MIGYILDYKTFGVKDIVEFSSYVSTADVTYKQTSSVALVKRPNISQKDYFVGYDDGFNLRLTDALEEWLVNADNYHLTMNPRLRPIVMGICQDVEESSGAYSIKLGQLQTLFDRTVLSEDEELREDGVELYLENLIKRNFINSGDNLVDLSYLEISTGTRTIYGFSLADNNGLVNITTAAATLLQKANIRMDMIPLPGKLHIDIYKDSLPALKLKDSDPDVVAYQETLNVSVVSSILVKWKKSDSNGEIGAITYPKFYLRSDKSVTMNAADPDRVDGQVTTIYIQAATIGDVEQKVIDKFGSNKYDHKAEISVLKEGLYALTDYYAGRKSSLYSQGKVLNSILTQVSYSDSEPFVTLTFGELPVTLTDKIRSMINGEL